VGPGGVAAHSGRRPWLGLVFILLGAAALRAWQIGERGYGNPYFSAGVRSMLESPRNFFFNAFDPAGFVSLDKPPVAFWVQVLSAKVFGFSGFSVLLPQLLEGLAAIAVLYYLVARRFGAGAGLVAGLALALSPVSVVMDRGSGTDSCLVLVLLLAAWAASSAVARARPSLFWASMAFVGVGFNVKMAEALGVVPAFAAVYLAAGPAAVPRRVRDVAIGLAILGVVSLSWPAIYDLSPATERPFVGSSTHNSMLELAAVYNGIDRFIPRARLILGRGAGLAEEAPAAVQATPPATSGGGAGRGTGLRRPRLNGGAAPAGPLRLFSPGLAAEAGWLLPFAALAVPLTLIARRRLGFRGSLSSQEADVLLWAGWALCYGVVYSAAGGMFRAYYLVTLAPPMAALAAIGFTTLWMRCGEDTRARYAIAGVFAVTALWQVYIVHGLGRTAGTGVGFLAGAPVSPFGWTPWLIGLIVGGTLIAAAGLLLGGRRSASTAIGVGLAALVIAPAASSLESVIGRVPVLIAPPAAFAAGVPRAARAAAPAARFREMSLDRKLISFLRANRHGERYLLATTSAMQAAPIIIATGDPVMAIGGFTGRDPILTVGRLADIVEAGELRFVMVGGAGGFGLGTTAPSPQAPILQWINEHGRPVDPSLWRSGPPATGTGVPGFRNAAPVRLLDLRPQADLTTP